MMDDNGYHEQPLPPNAMKILGMTHLDTRAVTLRLILALPGLRIVGRGGDFTIRRLGQFLGRFHFLLVFCCSPLGQ